MNTNELWWLYFLWLTGKQTLSTEGVGGETLPLVKRYRCDLKTTKIMIVKIMILKAFYPLRTLAPYEICAWEHHPFSKQHAQSTKKISYE